MPIYKRCSYCGRRIRTGTKCDCGGLNKLKNKEYDKFCRNKQSKNFYDSNEWNKMRKYILAKDRFDVYLYMTEGKIVPADTVHHIYELNDNWMRRLDEDNLMSLDHRTHSTIHQRMKSELGVEKELTVMLKKYRETILKE